MEKIRERIRYLEAQEQAALDKKERGNQLMRNDLNTQVGLRFAMRWQGAGVVRVWHDGGVTLGPSHEARNTCACGDTVRIFSVDFTAFSPPQAYPIKCQSMRNILGNFSGMFGMVRPVKSPPYFERARLADQPPLGTIPCMHDRWRTMPIGAGSYGSKPRGMT